MRRLYPHIGRLFARQTVEISLLIDPAELRARLDRPFDVDELTAGLDNETYLVTAPVRCLGAEDGEQREPLGVLGAGLGGVDHDAQVCARDAEHVAVQRQGPTCG